MKNIFKLFSRDLIKKRLVRNIARYQYPDWSKILIDKISYGENSYSATKNGPNILIATTMGIHSSIVIFESYLGIALALRGANVHFLLCDKVLPACQVSSLNQLKNVIKLRITQKLCKKCFKNAYKSIKSIGLPIHLYSEYLTKEEIDRAEVISQEINSKEIENYSFENYEIGQHAKAGALKFFARGTFEGEPNSDEVLRQFLKSSILTVQAIKSLIKKFNFNSLVFHHGIYVPEGVIGEVGRKENVRVVNWNPAYRKKSFIFSHNDTYHHTLMSESTSEWEKINWNVNMENEIINYLESRTTGGKDWISFVSKNPNKDLERISSELQGIDFSKPCIGMLTNVIWDAQLHYPANIFSNMSEWVIKTVKYFSNRKDIQLVIRIHPAEILGELPSRQRVLDEINKVFSVLPKNIFIIKPESTISTYKIMEQCNTVLIYGTKTGVELTSRGIPVIVAGEAWIRNKGLTIDPKSEKEYFELLDKLPLNEKMKKDQIDQAKKYAFHFFFRRMVPISQFELTGYIPPFRLNIKNKKDLLPGNDPGLDVICNGILNGTSFVYPAENYI